MFALVCQILVGWSVSLTRSGVYSCLIFDGQYFISSILSSCIDAAIFHIGPYAMLSAIGNIPSYKPA